jgi:hypothetical protein
MVAFIKMTFYSRGFDPVKCIDTVCLASTILAGLS